MGIDKEAEIVERELWDHYSELPNPSWYEYKDKEVELTKLDSLYQERELDLLSIIETKNIGVKLDSIN